MGKIKIILSSFIFLFVIYTNNVSAASEIIPWNESQAIPTSSGSNYSDTYNDYIYNLGGANQNVPPIYNYSKINPDGSIQQWLQLTASLSGLFWHTGNISNGYIYILGGTNSSITNINTVQLAQIQPNGDINSWQSTTSLPQTLSLGTSVIVGNKIYYAGGNNLPTFSITPAITNQNIYASDINPSDGTLGTWNIVGTLPERLIGFGMLEVNNYLYIFGGKAATGLSYKVARAPINPDGTIGNWENLESLNWGKWRFGIAKIDNTIIIAGGDENGITNKVITSDINPDGTLTPWVLDDNLLPYPNCCSSMTSYNNKIYIIGGHDGSNYTDKVIYTSVTNQNPTPEPTVTPSPTPISTPTPTPSPEPTINPISKTFFVPGFGGSWNADALVNCKLTNYSGDWTMAPYAKGIYQKVIDELSGQGWNTKVFFYDWRKDVRNNAANLSQFIENNTFSTEKVNLVGHSMGGLIGREYLEENNGGKLKNILTVGSPHGGVVQAYASWAGGEIWNTNLVTKIATTLYVNHCNNGYQNDMQAIQNQIPSVQNLLPTFDYLRSNQTNTLKPVGQMTNKNNWLPTYLSSPFFDVRFGTLSGSGFQTFSSINVKNPTAKETASNYWLDGKPTKKTYSKQGDGTVLLKSSQIAGAENEIINQDHSGIIASNEGVNKIIEFLGEPIAKTFRLVSTAHAKDYQTDTYKEPKSSIVLVAYPGSFWVTDTNGKITQDSSGMVALMNPKSGSYKVKIIPQTVSTTFLVAQFFESGKVTYKEYKLKGLLPKTIRFDFEENDDYGHTFEKSFKHD